MRPQEALWWVIGHDLLLLALGVAVLGKLDELLLLVLSLAGAAGRHCDMCESLCMREGVVFECREEGGEGRKGERAARQRERTRESDTWLPGWALRCNTHTRARTRTHTERLGGPLAQQRRAAHPSHRIAQGQQQQQQQLELGRTRSRDARRALVGNGCDAGAGTTFVGQPS